jgi:Ca-activated chloride channel family protein
MKRLLLTGIALISLAGIALGDGFIVPRPQPWLPSNAAVNVKYHHVDVDINDPIAITRVDQVFVNPYHRELEADYIFPIPENASISRFVAWLGGRKMEAELLDAPQARRIYEDIVRQRKDPALLEYAGRGLYRLRIYPIPANGEVKINIEYEQTLKAENGAVEYKYPLNTEKFSGANLTDCRIQANINSFSTIGSVYCPSHQIKVDRIGEKSMHAVYKDENVRPDKDFLLYFTRQSRDFGFHLLSYKELPRKPGYFLGIISPPINKQQARTRKNVIFVLDSSGSMRGEKFHQAQDALKFCLEGLNPQDYFNVIDYDDVVKPMTLWPIQASRAQLDRALEFADNIDAGGGTNIYEALAMACDMIPHGGSPTYIIFLTDGQPTVGITDIEQIISNTTRLNEKRARLFVFGVGYDVNAHLLDRLSSDNEGEPEYVLPNEDIEVKVSRLTIKITYPALTDIKLTFSSGNIDMTYPDPLPDLFYGSEIIVAGRFKYEGRATAVITGKLAGKSVTYEYPVEFDEGTFDDEFIPLLWANRRITFLVQQIRLHGNNDELLAEVIELSKKYGILTEYTSFLVAGDERHRPEEYQTMSREKAVSEMKVRGGRMFAEQAGKTAVTQSKDLSTQSSLNAPMASGAVKIEGETKHFDNIAQVGAQGFFRQGSLWVQGNLGEDKYDMKIKQYSKAYFQILDKDPSLGKYLGLGNQVRLQIGSQVVQFDSDGKESLTDSELKLLFQ